MEHPYVPQDSVLEKQWWTVQNIGLLRTQAILHLFIQNYNLSKTYYISGTSLDSGKGGEKFLYSWVHIMVSNTDNKINEQYNMTEGYECHEEY